LADEEFGIDLFYKAMDDTTKAKALLDDLRSEAQVKAGMAQRLVDNFGEWCDAAADDEDEDEEGENYREDEEGGLIL
jgi:hypothetical protein